MVQNSVLFLLDLFVMLVDLIKESRRGPIKTSVKILAKALGYPSAAEVPVEAFNLPFTSLAAKLDDYFAQMPADQRTGKKAIANIKNDVSYLLRLGRAGDPPLLPPLPQKGRLQRSKVTWDDLRRGEQFTSEPYILKEPAAVFDKELLTYKGWCCASSSFVRPAKMKRKSVTMYNAIRQLRRMAGYLVKFNGYLADALTLETLVIPENVELYLNWFIEQRGGQVTSSVRTILSDIRALLKYLIITSMDEEKIKQYEIYDRMLKTFKANLPLATPVHKKADRMVPLKQLEEAGLSCYPEAALQLATRPLEELMKETVSRRLIHDVMFSLILRILVRIPMRQRNIREMQWNPKHPEKGTNLYRRDLKWYFRYVGAQIKIATNSQNSDGVNRYEHEFPAELTPLLEEWLFHWRPLLLARQAEEAKGSEKSLNQTALPAGQELVFLTVFGEELEASLINWNIKTITRAFLGVAVNPHMIRTIWATAYIIAEKDIMGAALMLGDKAETVMKHYAYLLAADLRIRVKGFLERTLASEG